MTFFLHGQKVLGVVDGSIICPDETHPQYYTWIQCDDIALSWITSTLSRPVLETFLNHDCNSSNEPWNILQQLFLDHASATQMQLRYRFQHFTKGDLSMSDYLQQLHSIYRSLIDVGESLKDSDLVAQTLLGLPRSFSAFKTVMNASTPRPSFAALRPLLLSEEDNVVQSTKSSDSPDAMVLYSSTNNQQRSFNSSNSYNNGGRGRTGRFRGNSTASRPSSWNNSCHSKVDHNQSSYGPNSSSILGHSDGILGASPAAAPPLKATTKCQICGDFNHAALDCSNRFNHAYTSTHLHKSLAAMHFNDDSGNVCSILTSIIPYLGTTKVMVGNSTLLPITHAGNACLFNLTLRNVLLIPNLKKNILSVHQLCIENNCIKTKKLRLRCNNKSSLYFIDFSTRLNNIWHLRLGHHNSSLLSSVANKRLIHCASFSANTCNVCQLGKNVKQPFPNSITSVDLPFELVYYDVWESPVLSPSEMRYYVSFIDVYTRYTWVYPMKRTSDTLTCMQQFHSMIKNVFQTSLITFQADEGGKFHELELYFKQHGIQYRCSCPHTPQQNGIAERKHRHIVEKMRCLLFNQCFLLFFG
ncbi:hypothetical protein LIER_08014 [Lithospermum erythrorhizon]|uniref:Integrase catalytic domain-containing protein n=1 Tax=Lithospermum erythrorhizon TaxID=34254 RepID=A0AAV3PEA8_LITER